MSSKKKQQVNISKHSRKRLKERVGNGKSYDKQMRKANLAVERGYLYRETKGNLRKYILKSINMSNSVTKETIRIYNGKIWLFSHNMVLVTVLDLPSNLKNHFQNFIYTDQYEKRMEKKEIDCSVLVWDDEEGIIKLSV